MPGSKRFKNRSGRPEYTFLDRAKGYEVMWGQVSQIADVASGVRDVRYVYAVGEVDQGPLKIGYAKDPLARLRNMQTGNPRRLRLEHVLVGDTELEKLLHEMWEDYAIRSDHKRNKVDSAPGTEWFEPEIREELCPILITAARNQVRFIRRKETGEIRVADLERLVRLAHGQHGFVAKGRDEVRLLGAHGGYFRASRMTRI